MHAELRAVLTGDIAQSSEWPRTVRADLPGVLGEVSSAVQERFAGSVCRPLDVFRGDSWQLFVDEPASALRIALFVRVRLRASFEAVDVDTRVAVGIGTVDFVPPDDISGGDGEAFRLSGQALDGLGRDFRMAVALSDRLPRALGMTLDAVAKLIDVQAVSWTQRQASAVAGALVGLTQEEIGSSWMARPISQQTVAQHLASAGWNAVEYALSTVEAILQDEKSGLSL